jgi:hypothetical protein
MRLYVAKWPIETVINLDCCTYKAINLLDFL